VISNGRLVCFGIAFKTNNNRRRSIALLVLFSRLSNQTHYKTMSIEIPSKYEPQHTEDKWYGYWMKHQLFNSVPDEREPYTIVIPPPNVTGELHLGHMLNNTIQDLLVRRARMQGK